MRQSLLPLLALLAACGSARLANQSATVVSSASVYLRNTFDTDPSIYVGRFVPAGVTDLDESNTLALACSKHITTRFIEGGGVHFSEDLTLSTAVAARIGIPVVADVSASHSQSRSARADYVLTGKLVAEIADPEAFAACCKAQPDQCTDRFIGEFIQGTGSLLHSAARDTKVNASGTNPSSGVSGSGGLDSSAQWQRVAEFANPVYFAFKINPTAYAQGAVDTCPSWATTVPTAEGGVYVVGRSDNLRSEQRARNDALGNANAMAMQSAGLAHGSLGNAPMPIRTEAWCVTTTPVRRSVRYAARVLAFVSNESIAEAKKTAEALAIAEREAAAKREAAAAVEREAAAKREAAAAAEREAAAKRQPASPPPTDPTTTTPVTTTTTPPAAPSDFDKVVAAINAESFSADRLSALEFTAKNVRLTAAEARTVLDLLVYSGDKMTALKLLRDKITDPQNWNTLLGTFASSVDRDEARKLAP